MHNRPSHGQKREDAEDGQQDIVDDDKVREDACLADAPWLIISFAIIRVEAEHSEGVECGEGKGYLGSEDEVVEVFVDGEWGAEGAFGDGWRECWWKVVG